MPTKRVSEQTQPIGAPFRRSTRVKRATDETHEFGIRSKIAHLVERQRVGGSKISALSVVLQNGGMPDSDGNVRARVNTGKGYTYFTVPQRLLR